MTIAGLEPQDNEKLAQAISDHLIKLPGFSLSETSLKQSSVPEALCIEVRVHGILTADPDKPTYRIRYGKHKGKTFGQVPKEYVVWFSWNAVYPEDRAAAKEFLK